MNKKFINTWNIEDYEILTDTGWVDIISLHETIPYEIYNIKTSLGKELKCADNHILFDKNYNEIYVKDLNIGNIIITSDGEETITYIENTNIEENMYDFELSTNSNHRYFTNNILSHNTLLAKTIAKLLDVPFAIADSTVLTQAGYVGEDVESIIVRLLQAADYNIERTEMGIIFIDEIDKIARKGGSASITRDVSGEGVQQALLKLLEGSVVNVPPKGGRKHPDQPMVQINTENILFICGGAFDGIEKVIDNRLNKHAIGFEAIDKRVEDTESSLSKVTAQDIRKYGLIPEIIGRLPVITHTNELTKEQLIQIITEPKNAIVKQYKKLFEIDGITLTFDDSVYEYIADKAIERGVGARGLRGIMEDMMAKLMYNLPSEDIKEYNITLEYAKSILEN